MECTDIYCMAKLCESSQIEHKNTNNTDTDTIILWIVRQLNSNVKAHKQRKKRRQLNRKRRTKKRAVWERKREWAKRESNKPCKTNINFRSTFTLSSFSKMTATAYKCAKDTINNDDDTIQYIRQTGFEQTLKTTTKNEDARKHIWTNSKHFSAITLLI